MLLSDLNKFLHGIKQTALTTSTNQHITECSNKAKLEDKEMKNDIDQTFQQTDKLLNNVRM